MLFWDQNNCHIAIVIYYPGIPVTLGAPLKLNTLQNRFMMFGIHFHGFSKAHLSMIISMMDGFGSLTVHPGSIFVTRQQFLEDLAVFPLVMPQFAIQLLREQKLGEASLSNRIRVGGTASLRDLWDYSNDLSRLKCKPENSMFVFCCLLRKYPSFIVF